VDNTLHSTLHTTLHSILCRILAKFCNRTLDSTMPSTLHSIAFVKLRNQHLGQHLHSTLAKLRHRILDHSTL
jgi:hypothetical protein